MRDRGEEGKNQNQSGVFAWTPYIAAENGNFDVVRYLSGEAHADVNQTRSNDIATPTGSRAELSDVTVVLVALLANLVSIQPNPGQVSELLCIFQQN